MSKQNIDRMWTREMDRQQDEYERPTERYSERHERGLAEGDERAHFRLEDGLDDVLGPVRKFK